MKRYLGSVQVSESLAVEAHAGDEPGASIARNRGGLVFVHAGELRHLVEALTKAAGLLAQDAATHDAGPGCAGCGKRLEPGVSPYWNWAGDGAYLCDDCADKQHRG